MDVLAVRDCVAEHLRVAREDRRPTLVEALTYRFRGHSAADPEVYRTKEEVSSWRERDPIAVYAKRLEEASLLDTQEYERHDAEAIGVVDAAVEFADASPDPPLESLYDDIYVLGEQVRGWYSVDERTPEVHRGEQEREIGRSGTAAELAQAGAAHASGNGAMEPDRDSSDEQADEPPDDFGKGIPSDGRS
jgi:hypothetical protein